MVCVCTTNYPETAITMLAVMHAGGILTGMNPTFTPGETGLVWGPVCNDLYVNGLKIQCTPNKVAMFILAIRI